MSNLDALLREQVRAQLKQLFKEQNKPVVYVTHDQTEAMTLSSKVAVLNQGTIQQLDPPSRIYSHPANEFVASFVGSPQMNLLTLKCETNKAFLGKHPLELPPKSNSDRIIMGIRPEDVLLASDEIEATVIGQVYLVEQLGKDNLVSVRVDNSDTTIRALLPSDVRWEDKTIPLAIKPSKIHWFDVQTGDRLN